MPIYTLETGDGRRLKIEAETPELATAEADAWAAANPRQSAVGEAFSNIGPSAAQYASDIVAPFLSPVETAGAIKELGKGLYSKAAGALGAKQEPEEKAKTEAAADALGEYFKGRYGSKKAIEETFRKDPVAVAGDLATVLSLGGGLVARAPAAIAGPGGAGALGLIAKTGRGIAKAGEYIDPLMATGKATSAAGGLLGKTAAEITGVMSGAGSAPISQAYRAGAAGDTSFTTAMRGAGETEDALRLVESGIDQARQAQTASYLTDINALKTDKRALDYNPVMKALDDTKEIFSNKGSVFDDTAAATYGAVKSKLEEFLTNPQMQNTPFEFDRMKIAIGNIVAEAPKGSGAAKVGTKVYNAIVDEITSKAPTYAKTMSNYSEVQKLLSEIRKTFSVGGNPDTSLRKLQSVMRNNVNTNYGQRQKLIDILAQYEPSLPNVIAGQALGTFTPRGLAGQAARLQAGGASLLGIGGAVSPGAALLAIPSLAASSPRLLGETAYGLGRVGAGVGAVAPYARPVGGVSYQAGRAKEELDRLAMESAGLLGQ
jgi:hypothetical protein